MKLSIPDAALTAISGYAVVFLGLILLMAVVVIMGKIMTAKKAAAPAPAAAPTASAPAAAPAPVKAQAKPAPGAAGEVKLYDVSDQDAALLMAIVADKMGKPLNELRFKSMKEVK